MTSTNPIALREDVLELIKHACINGTPSLAAEADILYGLLETVVMNAHPSALTQLLESLREKLSDGEFQDNPDTPFSAHATLTSTHHLLTQVGGGHRVLANLSREAAPLSDTFPEDFTALPATLDDSQSLRVRRIQSATKGKALDPHFLLQRTPTNEVYLNIVERLPETELEPVRVRIRFETPTHAIHAANQDAFKVAVLWLLAEQASDDLAFTLVDYLTFPANHEALREENDTSMSDYSDYIVRLYDGQREPSTVSPTVPL